MSLTAAQSTTLGAYIAAQADLKNLPSGSDGAFEVARLLNLPDVSATILYAPAIPSSVLLNAVHLADMTALSAAQLAYLQMMLSAPTVDGTAPEVGTAIGTMFAGKQTLTNFTGLARNATRFELLYTTNHVVTPPLYGYQVSVTDVQTARGGF